MDKHELGWGERWAAGVSRQEEKEAGQMNAPRDVDQERLVRLEETVAHQEQLLGELNGALSQLRLDFDALLKHSRNAEMQIQWLVENSSRDQDPLDEKPPHY